MDESQSVDSTTEYLIFRTVPTEGARKTGMWAVLSRRHKNVLGTIKWYGAWRQYVFCPDPDTIFNRGCLEDINAFMDTQMRERRGQPQKIKAKVHIDQRDQFADGYAAGMRDEANR